MLCGTDNIPQNIHDISHINSECEEYLQISHGILSIPHNTNMELNNGMSFFFHLIVTFSKAHTTTKAKLSKHVIYPLPVQLTFVKIVKCQF